MINAYITAREMDGKEKKAWRETPSLVKKVEVLRKETVAQPGNIEAVVEGLLYIVGEDGATAYSIVGFADGCFQDNGSIRSIVFPPGLEAIPARSIFQAFSTSVTKQATRT